MTRILIVEDDADQADVIAQYLELEGFQSETIRDGAEALSRLTETEYDLIILDWQLPGLSGLELCARFRQNGGRTPILMVTGRQLVQQKEEGLDSGADDYLTKPFNVRELGARIRALLRRATTNQKILIKVADLVLDTQKHIVYKATTPINLAAKEFSLLEYLMRHANQKVLSERLIAHMWEEQEAASEGALRTCVNRLRRKLAEHNSDVSIETHYAGGYELVAK